MAVFVPGPPGLLASAGLVGRGPRRGSPAATSTSAAAGLGGGAAGDGDALSVASETSRSLQSASLEDGEKLSQSGDQSGESFLDMSLNLSPDPFGGAGGARDGRLGL